MTSLVEAALPPPRRSPNSGMPDPPLRGYDQIPRPDLIGHSTEHARAATRCLRVELWLSRALLSKVKANIGLV